MENDLNMKTIEDVSKLSTKSWDQLADCDCSINGKFNDDTKITDEANEKKFCKEDCDEAQYWNSAANKCQEGRLNKYRKSR